MNKHSPQPILGLGTSFIAFVLLMFLIFAAGCGGGPKASINRGPTPSPTPTPAPASTVAQIRIGDAAVDSIVDFKFSIGSPVVFTTTVPSDTVSMAVGANRFEMSHMAGKMEPLLIAFNMPQGFYTSAQITIQNPELTFLTPQGTLVPITGADQTVIVPFPPLSIGSEPIIVNLDVNLANSIVSQSGGTITGINFTPGSFNFSTKAIASESQQQDDSGEIESLVAKVGFVLDPAFEVTLTSSTWLPFDVDSTTQFSGGITNIEGAADHLVRVEGTTRTNSSLLAKKVEALESQSGSELDGLITPVAFSPASSLTLLAQDGIGNGMDPAKIGGNFTVDVSGLSASDYRVDYGKCDISGLMPSPNLPFDPSTIHPGQRIEADNSAGVPPVGGSFTADRLWLVQQAINGTVSNYPASVINGAATFDLTLGANSYLTMISGEKSVHVFQQPGTDNRFGTITNNSAVRVRGLLFWSGTGFNMIARRITSP